MGEPNKEPPYDRNLFLEKWAKVLKCKADVYSISGALIKEKNFDSAMAVLFNLSWRWNKEWLRGATDYFKKNFPSNAVATPEWLYQFQQHYVTEVAKYPDNA